MEVLIAIALIWFFCEYVSQLLISICLSILEALVGIAGIALIGFAVSGVLIGVGTAMYNFLWLKTNRVLLCIG